MAEVLEHPVIDEQLDPGMGPVDVRPGGADGPPLELGIPGTLDGPPLPSLNSGEQASDRPTPPGGTAEAAAEQQQDQANRYTNAEFLGNRYRVRRAIQESGTQAIKVWQGMKAKVRNGVATPGKWLKQSALSRAENSFAKKNQRLQEAQDRNASSRLIRIREAKAAAAKGRQEDRRKNLNTHITTMENRTKAVHENATKRRNEYIQDLKDKRGQALARKSVRQQLRTEGASRSEARAILADIPAKHLERVGTAALTRETSKRRTRRAERQEHKAYRSLRRTEGRITSAEMRIHEHNEDATRASQIVETINEVFLPENAERMKGLQREIQDLEPDSAEHARVFAELQATMKQRSEYFASIDRYKDATATSQYKRGVAQDQHSASSARRVDQIDDLGAAATETERRRTVEASHSGALEEEVSVVLNPYRKK